MKVINLDTSKEATEEDKASAKEARILRQWLAGVDSLTDKTINDFASKVVSIYGSTMGGFFHYECRIGGELIAYAPTKPELYGVLSYIFLMASQMNLPGNDDDSPEMELILGA